MIAHSPIRLALRAPLETLDALPDVRSWDNRRAKPVAGQPYIRESFEPGTSTFVGNGHLGGYSTVQGLYIITWSDKADDGSLTLDTRADDVLALYPPGTSFVTSDGQVVTIRADQPPVRGAIKPVDPGRVVVLITIAWTTTIPIPAVAA